MTTDDTAQLDPAPIQRAEVADLHARYGVTAAWFGFHSRRWWALDGGQLVEAATPGLLGEAVLSARRLAAGRWAP